MHSVCLELQSDLYWVDTKAQYEVPVLWNLVQMCRVSFPGTLPDYVSVTWEQKDQGEAGDMFVIDKVSCLILWDNSKSLIPLPLVNSCMRHQKSMTCLLTEKKTLTFLNQVVSWSQCPVDYIY